MQSGILHKGIVNVSFGSVIFFILKPVFMNLVHLHLLLNHFPIIGTFIALLILAYGIFKKNQTLINTATVLMVGITLITLPAFYTGEPAEEAIENLPGISHRLIHEHEEAAELAFLLMNITGIMALVYLLMQRMKLPIAQLLSKALLLATLITCILMARAGNEGGKIRHAELLSTSVDANASTQSEAEEHENN
jgi:uncharacterized membrane protein